MSRTKVEMEVAIETTKQDTSTTVDQHHLETNVAGKSRVFDSSTHMYLVYFLHDRDLNGFILAVITMTVQFILYGIMIAEGFGQLTGGKVAVITDIHNCGEANGYVWMAGVDVADTSSLECGTTVQASTDTILGGISLSGILLAYFMVYDILACIKIWFSVPGIWAKLMAALIFFEAMYAFYAGIIFAYISVDNGSSYEAIVNCIGVLFVHDLDEKIYEASQVIQKDEMTGRCCKCCHKCCKCCCIVCILLASIIFGFIAVLIIASQT